MGLEGRVRDVYARVTRRILDQLEQGVIPWRRPWALRLPVNLATRRPYRGVNVVVLLAAGYDSPYWVTFRQALALGGHVRKGERATPVVFWMRIPVKIAGQSGESSHPVGAKRRRGDYACPGGCFESSFRGLFFI